VDGGWCLIHPTRATGRLKVGQVLQLHDGTTVVVTEIDTSVRVEKVYNLTVANTHNYFVGRDGVLVHNCKKKKGGGKNAQHGKRVGCISDSVMHQTRQVYRCASDTKTKQT